MAGLNDKNRQEKIKSIEEMIQIVLLRIPKEIEAMHFYTKAAEKSTSDEAKNLFLSLAQQEKGHEAELRRILNDLKQQLMELKNG
ncbi:ferritin family protein [Calditerrivibrio nitroreducens]|uniref:Rubrerythrin n=1 Tax=Calditerrivibrio nitroreducens (strain DSM 19672 / NBRC 101217 / Yu37-1) TaxID=768670 RepID=E4TI33_CALNY|nr:ferritin family protein [Calditerrivibrio nitroreducens]ADR17930.1 Rubrerythrin [Calditerrivibrio nitroreducens DSM 19672]